MSSSRPWSVDAGVVRGQSNPDARPPDARPAPDPEYFRPMKPVGSSTRTLASVIAELVLAYRHAGKGLNYAGFERGVRSGKYAPMMERAAWRMIESNLSPQGYVLYVCRVYGRRRGGKFPYPGEVFGEVAVGRWADEYGRQALEELKLTPYRGRPR